MCYDEGTPLDRVFVVNVSAILVLGVAGVCAFAVVGTFNRLIRARNLSRSAWSSVDVNLKKRHQLIPNLVETVRGYANHEQELLTRVTELRARAIASTGVEEVRTEAELGTKLMTVMGLVESYPDLKADAHFERLSRTLTEIEEQISAARRAYNAAVLELNNLVEQFPTNLIASLVGIETAPFFEWSDR